MKIGITGTMVECEDFSLAAMDLNDHLARIAENKRKDVTADSLLAMVDHKHIDTIGALQWPQILTHYVPELSKYKEKVSALYRSKGAKKQINPHRKTKIHRLATNAKNETKNNELKEGLHDLLNQMGQRDRDYLWRLTMVGGDGLSFEKMVQLKRYLQFHPDAF